MSVIPADLTGWAEPGFDVVHVFHATVTPGDVVTPWAAKYLLQFQSVDLPALMQAVVEDDPPRWRGVWQSEPSE